MNKILTCFNKFTAEKNLFFLVDENLFTLLWY